MSDDAGNKEGPVAGNDGDLRKTTDKTTTPSPGGRPSGADRMMGEAEKADASETQEIHEGDLLRAVGGAAADGAPSVDLDAADTVADLFAKGEPVPLPQVLDIAKQIAVELDRAWSPDVFRNQIRPAAIVIWGNESKRLASLSQVRAKKADPLPPIEEAQFVPPEKLAGKDVGAQGDVFALGVLLYRLLSGSYPYEGKDVTEVEQARLVGLPDQISAIVPELPDAVDDFIDGLMAVPPTLRYPNPLMILKDIEILAKPPDELSLSTEKQPDSSGLELIDRASLDSPSPPKKPTTPTSPATKSGDKAQPRGSAAAAKAAPKPAAARKPHTPARASAVARLLNQRGVVLISGIAAGVLVLILAVGIALSGGSDDDPGTGESASPEDKRELEAKALLSQLEQMLSEGNYRKVESTLDIVGDRYAETTVAAALEYIHAKARKVRQRTEAEAQAKAEARRLAREQETLEAEAASFLRKLQQERRAGRLRQVVDLANGKSAGYESTRSGPAIRKERDAAMAAIKAEQERISLKQRQERLAKRAEAERKARRTAQFESLLDLALQLIESGSASKATTTIKKARALSYDRGRAKLASLEAFHALVLKAEESLRANKRAEALRHYRKALTVRKSATIARRVATLDASIKLAAQLSKARSLKQAGNLEAALAALDKALPHISDTNTAKLVKKQMLELSREIEFRRLLRSAQLASEESRWLVALSAADAVLKMRPGHADAEAIRNRARVAIGPSPEISDSVGLKLVLVPAGSFRMGDKKGEPDESPMRKVSISSLYMSVCEITNAQFEAFDPERKARRTDFSRADDMPVVLVSWREAMAFCEWLSQKEGAMYRLPTEAEWEWAARGKDGRAYPWGSDSPGSDSAWQCNIAPDRDRTTWTDDGHLYASPVGTYGQFASPCGVQDLAGNVWEWCLDWYSTDYYRSGDQRDPFGPESGSQRVLRGGSFANNAEVARATNRTAKAPGYREASIGFRVVRMLDPVFTKAVVETP